MRKITTRSGKALLIVSMAALGLLSVPVSSAWALAASDPTPPPTTTTLSDLRLELAWARLEATHARMVVMFDFAEQRTADVQQLIDAAKANGKDVAGLQTALDSLEAAFKQAQPIFDGTSQTIFSHAGFDASGNVTDAATATQTVKDLMQKDQQIGSILNPALQAFRQAIQEFRQSAGSGTATGGAPDLRLELAWARLQASHVRMEVVFDFADQRTAEVQQLIDRAKGNGKDVAGVQTALDNLETALKQARPIFESTNGTIASHPGFDANGNVTDASQALQTVKDLTAKDQQIQGLLAPAQQALQEAIQAFRQTNAPTPTPGP